MSVSANFHFVDDSTAACEVVQHTHASAGPESAYLSIHDAAGSMTSIAIHGTYTQLEAVAHKILLDIAGLRRAEHALAGESLDVSQDAMPPIDLDYIAAGPGPEISGRTEQLGTQEGDA